MTRQRHPAPEPPRLTRPYALSATATTVLPSALPTPRPDAVRTPIRWVTLATDGQFHLHHTSPEMRFRPSHRTWYQADLLNAISAAIDPDRKLTVQDAALRRHHSPEHGLFLRLDLAPTAPPWPLNPLGAQMLQAALGVEVTVHGCLACCGQYDRSTHLVRSLTNDQLSALKRLHRSISART